MSVRRKVAVWRRGKHELAGLVATSGRDPDEVVEVIAGGPTVEDAREAVRRLRVCNPGDTFQVLPMKEER